MSRRAQYVVVVRRGEEDVFRSLREHFATGPDATPVIYDRRIRDRRVIIQDWVPERRRCERRAPIDALMWRQRGFVVVRVDRPASGGEAGPRRAAGVGERKSVRARRARRPQPGQVE